MKPLIFVYVMTYGGVLAALIRPYTGFLIYVSFAIIKPYALWYWAIPLGNYDRTIAIGFLVGWILHGCGNWTLGRGSASLIYLVAYWIVLVIAAAMAPIPELGWGPVEPLSKTFLPILAGASLIDSVKRLKQLIWVIVISQGYLAYEFNLTYLNSPMFVAWEWTHAGLDNNGIAITMVTSIGMAFFLGIYAPNIWQRLVALACAALMAHVVLFSNSRGGMLAMIATGVVAFLLMPKRPKYLLLFGFAIVGVLAFAGTAVQERFLSSFMSKEEGSDEGAQRMGHWVACIQSMSEQPLGVGPRHWRTVAPMYGLDAIEAHSTWLQMGAELGVLGLACLLGYYLITMWRLYSFVRRPEPHHDPWFQYTGRMVLCSLFGFLVSAQFVTVDAIELPYYIALCGIGVLKVASAQAAEAPDEVESPRVAES